MDKQESYMDFVEQYFKDCHFDMVDHGSIIKQCVKEIAQQKKVQDIKGQITTAVEKIASLKEQLQKEKTKNAQALNTLQTIKRLLTSFKYEEEFFQLEGSNYAYYKLFTNRQQLFALNIIKKQTNIDSPTLNYFRYFNATNLLMDFFFNEARQERHHIDKIHFYAFENDPKEEIYDNFKNFLTDYFFTPLSNNEEEMDYMSKFFFINTTLIDQEPNEEKKQQLLANNLNLQRHSLMTIPHFKKSFSKALENRDLIDSYTKEWILINLFKAFSTHQQKMKKQAPRIHKFVIEKNDFLKLIKNSQALFHQNLILMPLTTNQDNTAYYRALDDVDSALKMVYSYSNNLYSRELKFVTTLDFSNSHYEPPRDALEYSLNTLKCELYLSKTSHHFAHFLSRDLYVNSDKF
ncbi:hypothetical protein [Helicobacter pylori]|uniref:hypothetical protein n=1 Tax=Helicobacter pylori TaxID=210 RepID=UPI000EB32396|nr:hypothetical protein [Helicobacter pylori]